MKAAAYARYSTDRQNENSIDTQLAAIQKYCQQNGHTVIGSYIDMAMTGTNTERPNFQRMIEDAKGQRFDAIIMFDMSRISRNVADWMHFRDEMRNLNVQVLSTAETLGAPDDPASFIQEGVTALLAQHMVLQTRQKSIAGVAERAKQGVFLGGYPPLGYDVENGQYVINSHEAEAVRLIFGLYASGASYNQILDRLKGYKGKRGAAIGKNSLHSILKNERYIGTYFWNSRKMKYMGKWAGGAENPEAVRIEGTIPAIINKETWERVQKRMSDNKRNAANTAKNTYLLSNLIECGKCGGTFTGRTSTNGKGYKSRSYVCGNKYRTRTCDAHNINADELEAAVGIKLREYLSRGDFDAMAEEIYNTYSESKGSKAAEKKELAKVEREIANGTKAILAGADYSELNEQMARLKVRKAELEELLAMSPELMVTKASIAAKLKKDARYLQDGDIERLIKSYITKIYAHSDELIITGGVNLLGCGDTQHAVSTKKRGHANGVTAVSYTHLRRRRWLVW